MYAELDCQMLHVGAATVSLDQRDGFRCSQMVLVLTRSG